MSAYIVPKSHIDAMLRAAMSTTQHQGYTPRWRVPMLGNAFTQQLDCYTADRVGQMLVDENVKSVCHRYGESVTSDNLPGPSEAYWRTPYAYPLVARRTPTPVEGLKLISAYEYQSCEHPGWNNSEAYNFCEALREFLIPMLPGYNEAPWSWDESHDKTILRSSDGFDCLGV